MSAPSMVRSRRPRTASSVATRRRRQSKRVAEIAEIDGNEVLACSPVTGKSLAEIANIPCKYFARETVRSFTVSLWGAVRTPVRHSIPNLRQTCRRRSRMTGGGERFVCALQAASLETSGRRRRDTHDARRCFGKYTLCVYGPPVPWGD